MKKISVFHVDAFTSQTFGGNTAGVVLEADTLTDEEMQKVASELNLPESAFLLKTNNELADFKLRYFTPKEEINFCGHATVGLSWLLATELGWGKKTNRIILETNIGLVPVEWKIEDGKITAVEMTQIAPRVETFEAENREIADLLGISAEEIDGHYPIKLANTGNWHLLIPVKNDHTINKANPRLFELGVMNKEFNISTTHLFTLNTALKGYDINTRDFAPAVGIPEDPVTGSANGALSGYLFLEGIINQNQEHHLTIAQGHAIGRPGTLYATILPGDHAPIIKIAGSAVVTIAGVLTIQ